MREGGREGEMERGREGRREGGKEGRRERGRGVPMRLAKAFFPHARTNARTNARSKPLGSCNTGCTLNAVCLVLLRCFSSTLSSCNASSRVSFPWTYTTALFADTNSECSEITSYERTRTHARRQDDKEAQPDVVQLWSARNGSNISPNASKRRLTSKVSAWRAASWSSMLNSYLHSEFNRSCLQKAFTQQK